MDKIKFKPYSQALFFVMFIAAFAFSASTSLPALNDPYTGLYYVHGSKIVKSGSLIDTTHITSVIAVKLIQEKVDTLHFFGLPGVDEGESKIYFGRFQLRDNASTLLHYDDFAEFRIYGFHSEHFFEIDFNFTDRFYKATGSIIEDNIEIHGLFTGRSISVEYNLQGEKIEKNQ